MTGVEVIPTVGVDVTASGSVDGLHRRRQVVGPQDRTGVGGQGVDGVVLGGGEDPPGRHEGLAVELTVEDRRCPGLGGR